MKILKETNKLLNPNNYMHIAATILILGDLKIMGKDLSKAFASGQVPHQMINFVHPNDFGGYTHPDTIDIDFRDFHTLTIQIFELDPDIVFYIPPYRGYWSAQHYPDYAEISNCEAILHLIDTIEQFQAHFILFSSDQVACEISDNTQESVAATTLKLGESHLASYRKSTMIRPGYILNASEYGIMSWLHAKPQFQDHRVQTLDINVFIESLVSIIKNQVYKTLNLVSDPLLLSNLKKLISKYQPLPAYYGQEHKFDRPFCQLDKTPL